MDISAARASQPVQARNASGASGEPSALSARDSVIVRILKEVRNYSGEDQAIMLAIAELESHFDPEAKNPESSAHGIFQIINSTWRGLGFDLSQRDDLAIQIRAGKKLFDENLRHLKKRGQDHLHGTARAVALYRLHHDGPGGMDLGGQAIAERYLVPLYMRFNKTLASR